MIYFNGELSDAETPLLFPDDAGFQHAVGLFETMQAVGGRVFRQEQHLKRLIESAAQLGWRGAPEPAVLADAVREALAANPLPPDDPRGSQRVRLTVTPGRMSLLRPADTPVEPTIVAAVTPAVRYDPAYFEQGVSVRIGPAAASGLDPTGGHKTLNYWARLLVLREAAAAGAAEAIWLAPTNHLACGCVSNLFLVRDGVLQTPLARGEEPPGGMPMGVLPGVTRAALLELAEEMAIPTERRMLAIDDLLDADEVFLTNSSWRVLPVKAVERKSIGGGAPGPVTRRLRSVLLRRIDAETARDTTGA